MIKEVNRLLSKVKRSTFTLSLAICFLILTACENSSSIPEEISATPANEMSMDSWKLAQEKFIENGGIHTATGFPYDQMTKEGQPNLIGEEPKTNRTAIAYLIEYYLTTENYTALKTIMQSLINAQSSLGYQGLLPWMKFSGDSLAKFNNQYAFVDNINLTMRIAMIIGNSNTPADIKTQAQTFIDNQKAGYEGLVDTDGNGAGDGMLRGGYDGTSGAFLGYHIDRFFQEFRAGIAFVVAYYGIADSAWDMLATNTWAYKRAEDTDGGDLHTFEPWHGGAFQYTWSPGILPESELNNSLKIAEYNGIYIHLNKSKESGHVGLRTATAQNLTGQSVYNGNVGLNILSEQGSVDEFIFSIYPLINIYPRVTADNQAVIRRWLKKYHDKVGESSYGSFAGYASKDGSDYIADWILGLDTLSSLSYSNQPSQWLKAYLQSKGKYTIIETKYQLFNPPTVTVLDSAFPEPP